MEEGDFCSYGYGSGRPETWHLLEEDPHILIIEFSYCPLQDIVIG